MCLLFHPHVHLETASPLMQSYGWFQKKSHLLEEVKEALVRCNLLSGVQQRVLLLLGEGVGAPVHQTQLFKGVNMVFEGSKKG